MNITNDKSKLGDSFTMGHIGGNSNDSQQAYRQQKAIMKNEKNTHDEILDINRKSERDNNVERKWRQDNERTYRFNYNPISANGPVLVSNDLVFPQEYDDYFEYLYKKGLRDVNVQVQVDKTRINIDSNNRNIIPNTIVESYISLSNDPITFTDNSQFFTVTLNNADQIFQVGDLCTLTGFEFYTVNFKQMKIFFNNQSKTVTLNLKPNFNYTIPYYDIVISISGVTNSGNDYFKNIPLTIINSIQNIGTSADGLNITFDIPFPFSTANNTDETLVSDCSITFFYVGNYPINLINAKYPITQYNLIGYQTIYAVSATNVTFKLTNTISITNAISLNGSWKGTAFSTGGRRMQIGKIIHIEESFTETNNYIMPLESNLNNILCIKMISSEFVNTQKVFTNIPTSNTKLYWQNALDSGEYSISLPAGNYDTTTLKATIEKLMREVPRNIINSPKLLPINDFTVNFNTDANITSFHSYNIYELPLCLEAFNTETINDLSTHSTSVIVTITILMPEHNQQVGNTIEICGSTDYYTVNRKYINGTHKVTKVVGNDKFEIQLVNRNPEAPTPIDTRGGYEITIKTDNSFRLLFNKLDTFGTQMGFVYAGNSNSITPYCDMTNNYTITNHQPYVFNIGQIAIVNNSVETVTKSNDNINLSGYGYFLIRCHSLNKNVNPNGLDFFYKIQLNGKPNAMMFNTFVDTPIYFNPPLNVLTELRLSFTDPNGNPWQFYGIGHSFTLEITTVSNLPANTNVSTYLSKL
jgi:hypothetical protein